MQMQDKAKGTQSKHAERVDCPKQITSCILYPKRHNTDKVDVRKHELIELSNVNIYIAGCLSIQTTDFNKIHRISVSDGNQQYPVTDDRHGPNSFSTVPRADFSLVRKSAVF